MIQIEPNTFYKRISPSADGILDGHKGDLTILSKAAALASGSFGGPNNYILSSNIPNSETYGQDGKLSQVYLHTNVLTMNLSENFETPMVKLWKLKDTNYSLSYGTVATRADNDMVAFSSVIDYEKPNLVETFSGENISLGEDVKFIKDNVTLSTEQYYIPYSGFKSFVEDQNALIQIEGKMVVGDVAVVGDNIPLSYVPATGRYTVHNGVKNDGIIGMFDSFDPDQFEFTLDQWRTYTGISDHWRAETREQVKMQSEETFLAKANTENTIFNTNYETDNWNDIKVQTLEGTGDDTNSFAFSNAEFTTDDFKTGGQSMMFNSFWENYSGTSFTSAEIKKAAFPGTSSTGHNYPQEITYAINSMPEIVPLELGSGSSAAPYRPETPTITGEYEVVFKIKQMGGRVFGSSSASGIESFNMLRSFNITLSNIPHRSGERFFDYIFRTQDGDNSFASPGVLLGMGGYRTSTNSNTIKFFDMQGQLNLQANGTYINDSRVLQKNGIPTAHVELPTEEWITARFKIDPRRQSQLVYFPSHLNDNGSIKSLELTMAGPSGTPVCSGSLAPRCMVINSSNMRAINNTDTTASPMLGNKNLVTDIVPNIDVRQQICLDNISVRNLNHRITNATYNSRNKKPAKLNIPYPMRNVPMGRATSSPETSGTSSHDNYFMKPDMPVCSFMSFGFDNKPSDGQYALLMSTFQCMNPAPQQIHHHYTKFGYVSGSGQMGILKKGHFDASGTKGALGAAGTATAISIGGLPNDVERFRQKGNVNFQLGNGAGGGGDRRNWADTGDWTRRENPLVQSRILSKSSDGLTISVDTINPFKLASGSRYIAYELGEDWAGTGTSRQIGASDTFPLEVVAIDDRKKEVTLSRSINAIFGTSDGDVYSRCAISPYKYWLNVAIMNAVPDNGITGTGKWGTDWYKSIGIDLRAGAQRSYTSALLLSATGSYGTTYNEFLYSDTPQYTNMWDLRTNKEDGVVETQKDYGFGVYTPADNETTEKLGGYVARHLLVSGTNFIDLSDVTRASQLNRGDNVTFMMTPFKQIDKTLYNLNISQAGFSTNTAHAVNGGRGATMIFGFKTTPPVINDFRVNPSFDLLKQGIDIDTIARNANTVTFNWDEKGGSRPWYRLLIVDNKHIANKYHTMNFYAPLDEAPSDYGDYFDRNNPIFYTSYDNYPDSPTAFNAGSTCPHIEGFSGYAHSGGTSIGPRLTNSQAAFGSTGSFTFGMHVRPQSTNDTLFAVSSSHLTNTHHIFDVRINSSKQVVVTVASGTSTATLTSTQTYACNGIEPLAIYTTYNKDRENNNLKLFINGQQEDSADYTTSFVASGNIAIGADLDNSDRADGLYNEIFCLETEAYIVPNGRKYVLNTSHLPDLNSGKSNFYQARLFAFDYHNIKGSDEDAIGQSDIASWKVTGVN